MPYSRCRQSVSQVQHVVLRIARLVKEVVGRRSENDVACGAGQGALASAFEVDRILVRNVEEVFSLEALDAHPLS